MSRRQQPRRVLGQKECGPCRSCCVTLSFNALPGEAPFAKLAGEPCRHLNERGCGIYAARPPVCRRFQCAWLQAPEWPLSLRAHECGVLIALNSSVVGEGDAVYAYEERPGAADAPRMTRLLAEIAERVPVVLVRHGGALEVLAADPHVARRLGLAEV
jgi:hypothetical protein